MATVAQQPCLVRFPRKRRRLLGARSLRFVLELKQSARVTSRNPACPNPRIAAQ
jgi:hypothetical protein